MSYKKTGVNPGRFYPPSKVGWNMRVFWNATTAAERGDCIPNWSCPIKAKSKANYSCFVQRAINVSPTQYTDNSAAAFKYFAPFLPPRCHRAAPPIVRRRFIPRGKMVSLLLQFQQCTVRHSCCCTQFQWSTVLELCTGGGGTAAAMQESLHRIGICGQHLGS